MKTLTLLFALVFSLSIGAQQSHGKVYGTRPNTAGLVDALKLETYMGTKTRVNTTLKGRIISVTKEQGGWFTLDAGNGRTIVAHFSRNGINIPADLKGRTVIVQGIAEKQFVAADKQHFAGDSQRSAKDNASQNITFEVTGMMVE